MHFAWCKIKRRENLKNKMLNLAYTSLNAPFLYNSSDNLYELARFEFVMVKVALQLWEAESSYNDFF